LLRERGVKRVRPLAGGFKAWRQQAYPVEERLPESAAAREIEDK